MNQNQKKEKLTVGFSIVAFLDILGYQAFLASNSAAAAAETIFDIIQETPEEAKKEMLHGLSSDPGFKDSIGKISHQIVSDTIIISLSHRSEGPKWEIDYASFILFTKKVTESLFIAGMPVRGAITEGEFISRNTLIAGSAVIEAYKLSQQLEFSGVVLSTQLSKTITDISKTSWEMWDFICPYYMCPLKEGQEFKTRIVNWTFGKPEISALKAVRTAFWKWGKDIPRSVDEKVENTVKTLDFFAFCRETRNRKKKLKK